MRRWQLLVLVLVAFAWLPATKFATSYPVEYHWFIPTPDASAVNQAVKVSQTITGSSFACIARGGTATDLKVKLRQCTGAGATSCGDVSSEITLNAVDTEVAGTITGATWTQNLYLEAEVVSLTAPAPQSLLCSAFGRAVNP